MPPALTLPAPRARALAAVTVATAALALTLGSPARAAAPLPFVGMVSEDAFAGSPTYRDATLGQLAALRVGTVRQTLDWSVVEPRRGNFRWATYDAWVESAARDGIQVLPVLFNPPSFASSRPARGARRGTYPPRDNAEFAAFAREAAERYGPGGTFWRDHPGLPQVPIRSWQVWNEPNLPVYWASGPSAAQYVALLRATSSALKQVDPSAEVLTAGLPRSKLGIPLARYIGQMYRAGALGTFDTLAVNPYARDARGVLSFLETMRGTLDRHGDRKAGLWATEIGWSDQRPDGRFSLGRRGQGRAIGSAFSLLWKARRSLRLRGVVYFNWRDAPPYPGGKDFWGLHTGLLTEAGKPKPALTFARRSLAQLR